MAAADHTVEPTNRTRRRVRPLLALAAVATGLGLASGFVAAIVLLAGLGWYISAAAPAPTVAGFDASLDHVLVDAPEGTDDEGFAEPVRREVPVRRSARIAPAPVEVAPAVAEASSDEASSDAPSRGDAIRALRARMASGELDVVEGEAGRVSVVDG